MLSARFKLNSLGATDEAVESARDRPAESLPRARADTDPAPVCVARRVKADWRDSSAATLTLTAGGAIGLRGEEGALREAPCKSTIDRVARRAGETTGARTRRGTSCSSSSSSGVGASGDECTGSGAKVAVVPEARTGETCGEASDGLRASVRELPGLEEAPATLRSECAEDALRSIPGLRFSDVPEGTFRSAVLDVAGSSVELLESFRTIEAAAGGMGNGRAGRFGRVPEQSPLTDATCSAPTLIGDVGVAKAYFSGV